MKKLNIIKTVGILIGTCLFATTNVVNAAEATTYQVKSGDSLYKIAEQNGLSLEQLIKINESVTNPNLIYVGDKINLDTKKTTTKTKATNNKTSNKKKTTSKKASGQVATTGYAHPLNMPGAPVSSEFGYRQDPTGKSGTQHDGIDLAVATGTPVYAVKSGVVVDAGFHYSAGNYVIIKHADGKYTYYFHLSSINTSVNQQVGSLEFIGEVGTTGYSTGPHLHFGISSALWSGFENPRNLVTF